MVLASAVDAGEKSSSGVEVVIGGKSYVSTQAYKRDKIKTILSRDLSPNILNEFTNKEILEIIKEVRRMDFQRGSLPGAFLEEVEFGTLPATGDDRDLGSLEMERMLDKYQNEHKGSDPVTIDPDKLKYIIIETKRDIADIKME